MTVDHTLSTSTETLGRAKAALQAAETLLAAVGARVAALCLPDEDFDAAALNANQIEAHGYAWMASYVEILKATLSWAEELEAEGALGRLPGLVLEIGFGEYLAQIGHGIAMSQDEIIRPDSYGLGREAQDFLTSADVRSLTSTGTERHAELIALLRQAGPDAVIDSGDATDETAAMIREQFRSFARDKIVPHAQTWHGENQLIPIELVSELAELGVFGMTTPAEFGGSELGAEAMCVVTEELSAGYIGVGSLGTRSEIASELIRLGGTEEQKQRWLPRIASGEVLPTAVFTEPNTGSDLANLTTRAERHGDVYRIHGAKTWITHAARADIMVLLARTGAANSGHRGLTMFIAEKPRGTEGDLFPAKGMSGGEIHVLGYRGMREYELGFDGFEIPAGNVLGGVEGQGFRQLMTTFELARIQTAARALGVAQNAFQLGFQYATDRVQFARPLIEFPRVFGKLAWMAVEQAMVRQLVKRVARLKETGARCDVEAGMAKLVAARVAWSAADNALQIHGGNGYATEYAISRVLCDARILNIFEGAAEIQAQVIARGLLQRPMAKG
ncbi:acyl-CoA dehydrogenase family protein [Rhizobium sp. AN80A]|uniref:acyl-CoA dehydrogenase family protein n=1 Tax=Rhizobium sp. AN80A TaxID=3040673 RepID=UPI0024B323AA|nr:acyl-CoA dehydrogenase family protein [Rhizobium sp. AN80A]